MINTRVYAINIVPNLDFKTADSLISGEVDPDTFSADRVLYTENFHGKAWQSQGQLWSTTLAGRQSCLFTALYFI